METHLKPKRVNIYLVEGIETETHFFQPLVDALKSRFESEGVYVTVRTLYPYGYQKKNIMKQFMDMRSDLHLYPEKANQSIGGQLVKKEVRMLGSKDPILFIGHGGGGIAAYHAAELLEQEYPCEIRFIVQVGSPKVPISQQFRSRVGFLTKKGIGVEGDPSSWQGSWSHAKYLFSSHRYPGLLFNHLEKGRRAFMPGNVAMVEMAGQSWRPIHYFSPAIGRGSVSNLAKTMSIIWNWFHHTE